MSSTQSVDTSTSDADSRVSASDHPRTVSDLPDEVSERPMMQPLADVEIPEPLKDPVEPDDLDHRRFRATAFWKKVPAFANVDVEEFLDYRFQNRNSVTNVDQLAKVVGEIVDPRFLEDVRAGLGAAPMQMRLSPYTLGLVDWSDPWNDPLRIQFLPVGSTLLPTTRACCWTPCTSSADSPALGLVHRYPDKALFLAARRLPGLLPLLHAQLRDRRRHRHRRQGALHAQPRAGTGPSPTSPRGPRSRMSSSPAATRTCSSPKHLARSADAAGHPAHPAHPLWRARARP
jgi:hypothetical protein